jgi:lysine 2,3-aminomutase
MSEVILPSIKASVEEVESYSAEPAFDPKTLKFTIMLPKEDLLELMWLTDHYIKKLLRSSGSLHEARDRFFDYLNVLERHYFNVYSDRHFKDMHMLEKNNSKECIRVLKNVIRSENDRLTGFSALQVLYDLARGRAGALRKINEGFLAEFIYLFKGINGKSDIFCDDRYDLGMLGDNRQASINRSLQLDNYSLKMQGFFYRYRSGLDEEIIRQRDANREKILDYFRGSESSWKEFSWQMSHVIKDYETLASLVSLDRDERDALRYAGKNDIPVLITPYYLSLFNRDGRSKDDAAIRAQVLPSMRYCKEIIAHRKSGADMDFMGERWTSPIETITRRYPQILILKPYDSCPQLCVYCQRNWEIKSIDRAKITRKKIHEAISWIEDHESITEVLVTGGDPLTLSDHYIKWLVDSLSSISQIERIRIGTRVFVTLPFRITETLAGILKKRHEPGKREVCLVTHFEHPMEMTPDSLEAIQRIRQAGMSVYNQQVFTYYNSKKFETSKLRKVLKVCGVDPYYTFNTKGKEETVDFRVPIARIEQERKEEARLLPGIIRTDEPVFNVPRLGKSHLRAWQDHEVIMIMPDGRRAYRFYPWESKLSISDTYIYTDVSIYDYLKRLYKDGEDLSEYKTIWYYF